MYAVCFSCVSFSFSVLSQEISWEERLQNYLLCQVGRRMPVFDWRTLPVPHLTCSWRVTTYVGKLSAIGQPTRPT